MSSKDRETIRFIFSVDVGALTFFQYGKIRKNVLCPR